MSDHTVEGQGGIRNLVMGADSPLAEIDPRSNILVSGAPMTGKYELMLHLLARHTDRTIVISTKHQASRVLDDFREIVIDFSEERFGVIDCASHHDAIEDLRETETIKYASSPENLTRIGVKFTELFERFYGSGGNHTGVGIHSISQLLMHSDVKKVYQFLQVLTGQVRSAGWFGVAVLDTATVDDEQAQTLQHHFDGLIQTRENDAGQREFRVRGVGPRTSEWLRF